jgi:hypothetical protein
MKSDKIAHLEMIQRTIDRMAGESARLKGLAVLATAIIISAAAATESEALALAGLIPIFLFWYMDAQYLSQERWFRELYDNARGSTNPADFLMTPNIGIRQRHGIKQTLLGWSTAPFYSALGLVCLALALALSIKISQGE